MDETKAHNIDILGAQWRLAPGGRDLIDRCQTRLSDLHYELHGIGALFKTAQDCELSADELYGIGIVLEKVSRRLSKLSDRLSKVITDAR